ncbi:hypothetical protein [Pedobacter nanyangensis]|uniref:hypothetical protein n=1 Tax=Pedobacter nanyangensis TaxID=1562389 RepID=UPI000DE36620|nr:hypothetical protein [Pedobacter nanyangensis]
MTKQEEQLWNYIDGFCTDQEKAEITAKLAVDAEWQMLYRQLLEINKQLAAHVEIDEPSMAFTRNVMERVQHEIAPVALKTRVDQRIIYAIGGFFTLTLLGILGYAFATADFKDIKLPNLGLSTEIDQLVNPMVLRSFLFINAVLLLICLDSFIRKRNKKAQKKGEL